MSSLQSRFCMHWNRDCSENITPWGRNASQISCAEPLGTCMLPQQQSDTRSAQQQPLLDQIIKYTGTCLAYYSSPSSFCGCGPENGVHPGRVTTAITRPPPILMIHLGRFVFEGSTTKLTQKVQPFQLTFCLWHIARPVHHSIEARHPVSHCFIYDLLPCSLLLNLQMLVVTGMIKHTPLLQIGYPEQLDMGQYMINGLLDRTFVLRGVLVHEGATTACGHYYTYVFRHGEWWRYDDAECCVVRIRSQMYKSYQRIVGDDKRLIAGSCFSQALLFQMLCFLQPKSE